jgi:hypothetical protein
MTGSDASRPNRIKKPLAKGEGFLYAGSSTARHPGRRTGAAKEAYAFFANFSTIEFGTGLYSPGSIENDARPCDNERRSVV